MLKFDRKKFFDGVKTHIDSTLEQEQVDGFTFLLDRIEAEPLWSSIPLIAYGLATPYHETAGSMKPVEEGYYLGRYGKKRVKDFQRSLRYFPYFGRGFVQLTWETRRIPNYSKATRELREQRPELVAEFEAKTGKTFDLVKNPDQALDPIIAFAVMTLGMFQGWFTTKKITDFIHGSTKNYVDARTVINGHDKAALIAGYAKTFEAILQAASGTVVEPLLAEPVVVDTSNPPAPPASGGVVVEKEETVGFFKGIKLKLGAWFAGFGGLTTLQQYKEQIDTLGMPGWVIAYLFIGAFVVFLGWLAYEAYDHLRSKDLKRLLTVSLINANSTATNLVVTACQEDLDKFAAAGWTVVPRQ